MRNIFDDERVLFALSSLLVAFNIWLSQSWWLDSFFWMVAAVWTLTVILCMKLKRHILKAETWARALELGTFTRRVAVRFYVLVITLLSSLSIALFIAAINGLFSIFYSTVIGGVLGMGADFGYRWFKRRKNL